MFLYHPSKKGLLMTIRTINTFPIQIQLCVFCISEMNFVSGHICMGKCLSVRQTNIYTNVKENQTMDANFTLGERSQNLQQLLQASERDR